MRTTHWARWTWWWSSFSVLLILLTLDFLLQVVVVSVSLFHHLHLSEFHLVLLQLSFSLLRRKFSTEGGLVAQLTTIMTDGRSFGHLFFLCFGRWGWQLESGMHIFTTSAIWTETSQIIGTQYSSYVTVSTSRTVPAKTLKRKHGKLG